MSVQKKEILLKRSVFTGQYAYLCEAMGLTLSTENRIRLEALLTLGEGGRVIASIDIKKFCEVPFHNIHVIDVHSRRVFRYVDIFLATAVEADTNMLSM